MSLKICFKCKEEKSLNDFYKHSSMKDGYLGKCKNCTKKDTALRTKIIISTLEGLDKERARHREKYYRLGYKEKHKPTPEKKKEIIDRYKEKYPEKIVVKNHSSEIKPLVKGNQLHHWNYNINFAKDVIELSMSEHSKAHRFINYDQSTFMYKDENGVMLDSKEKHINFLLSKGINIIPIRF